jgi:pimeloyl-ACP methyl ester carboxylesterase
VVPTETFVENEGVRLCLADFGGEGSAVLILHGLGGSSSEWSEVARSLSRRYRVIALDLRAHGKSDKGLADVSPEAYRADVCAALEHLKLGSVSLVGHSFGGYIALAVASDRPDLVHGLIVVEASAAAAYSKAISDWFRSWPVPFSDRDEAERFFSASGLDAQVWADALEETEEGLQPTFLVEDMVATLEGAKDGLWETVPSIRAPTLLITGERGLIPHGEIVRTLAVIPGARHLELARARHDVHLDGPDTLVVLIKAFLEDLSRHA